MKVKASMATSWARAYKAALATEGKETDKTPTDAWKRQMLLAEHSPIRLVEYDVKVDDIKQWVTTHIVRHWLGFIPFVHSQRDADIFPVAVTSCHREVSTTWLSLSTPRHLSTYHANACASLLTRRHVAHGFRFWTQSKRLILSWQKRWFPNVCTEVFVLNASVADSSIQTHTKMC